MEWIATDPKTEYESIDFKGVQLYLCADDVTADTIASAEKLCDRHGLSVRNCSEVYYLRGEQKKAAHDKVLIGIVEPGRVIPKELQEIIHCLKFWNQTGEENFKMNGKDHETYQDFILDAIASDCRVFVKPVEQHYITGRGGNHVWVAASGSGERILIIHF